MEYIKLKHSLLVPGIEKVHEAWTSYSINDWWGSVRYCLPIAGLDIFQSLFLLVPTVKNGIFTSCMSTVKREVYANIENSDLMKVLPHFRDKFQPNLLQRTQELLLGPGLIRGFHLLPEDLFDVPLSCRLLHLSEIRNESFWENEFTE